MLLSGAVSNQPEYEIEVVWTVLCDEQWYADLFAQQQLQSTSSTTAAKGATVASALVNEQQRVACCERFNELQLRMKTELGSSEQSDNQSDAVCELVQKCALDELMFWLVNLGISDPLLDLMRAYGFVILGGGESGKYELGRAVLRQFLSTDAVSRTALFANTFR